MGRPWPATNCSRSGGPGHFKYMPVYGSLMILCEVKVRLEPDAQTYFDIELHNGQQINLQWRCAVRIRSRSGFRVNFSDLS